MSLHSIIKLANQIQKFAGLNKAEFNALRTLPERLNYLKIKGYQEIGEGDGSSRKVFIMSSKKVLKLAANKAGIAQNRTESKTLTEIKSKYIPKFYDKAPDDSWIEVELVRPLGNGDYHGTLLHNAKKDPEFKMLIKILEEENDFNYIDLISFLNLGINSSGNIVFLDLGGTQKIIDHYYFGNEEHASYGNDKYEYVLPDNTMKKISPTNEWISKDPKNK